MSSSSIDTNRDPRQSSGPCLRDAIVLALLIGMFFTLFLGSRPLSAPDENRYVEIPREMAVTGDWLTPRLNFLPLIMLGVLLSAAAQLFLKEGMRRIGHFEFIWADLLPIVFQAGTNCSCLRGSPVT